MPSRIPNAKGDGSTDDTAAVIAWLSCFAPYSIVDFGGWDCIYSVGSSGADVFRLEHPLRIKNAHFLLRDCSPTTDFIHVVCSDGARMDGWGLENIWVQTSETDCERWRHTINIDDPTGLGYRNFHISDVLAYPSAQQSGNLIETTYHTGDVGVIYFSRIERVQGWVALNLQNIGDSVTLLQPEIASRGRMPTRSLVVSTVPGAGEFHVVDPNFQANAGVLVGDTVGFHVTDGVSEAQFPLMNATGSFFELLGKVDTAWINDHQFQGGAPDWSQRPKAAFIDYGCRNITIRSPRLGEHLSKDPFTVATEAKPTTRIT